MIALLLGESTSGAVADLLRSDSRVVITALNVAEVIDALVRVAGRPLDAVQERIDWLVAGGMEVDPVTESIGRLAGTIRSERYHRTQRPLSMADCVALAAARTHMASLATSDRHMATTAREESVEVIALAR